MNKLVLLSLGLLAALLLAVSALAANKTITVGMSGKQETPKGSPHGTGTAKITLEPSRHKVCFRLTWSGIDAPTASHIHKGRKGTAGPVVVPLFATPPKHTGCVTASKSLITKIEKSPSAYYVNIHTKKYPAGALRGQL
ncbi:MAG: CHRD domain-containing protein [Thermoleophilaceae bacterium]